MVSVGANAAANCVVAVAAGTSTTESTAPMQNVPTDPNLNCAPKISRIDASRRYSASIPHT
jgi:hypothetical protein